MSRRTQEAYARWCAQFFSWSKCSTKDCLDSQLAEAYLTHLAVDRKVSASTQNQCFNALLFLYRNVLDRDFSVNAKRANVSKKVPEWLTRDEIASILKHLSGDWLLLARLGYGTGMRLMELLRLRVKDVDFGNKMILVRDGKGNKNRIALLPHCLRDDLRERIRQTKLIHDSDLASGLGSVYMPHAMAVKFNSCDFKWQYVFPSKSICVDESGARRRHHLFETGFQSALRKAGIAAGIRKRVHPHILRHTFATHFLENGGHLLTLKELLGHEDVKTTMIYTHCLDLTRAVSPADRLDQASVLTS